MASTAASIMSALATKIAAIDGTGSYTHDLSAAGQVTRSGWQDLPQFVGLGEVLTVAQVTIWVDSIATDDDANLGWYHNALTVGIRGLTAPNSTTYSTREDAALNLLHDVRLAIEADRTLGVTAVRDVHTDLDLLFSQGEQTTVTGPVGIIGRITVDYAQASGV